MTSSESISSARSATMNDECRQVRQSLPIELLAEPDGELSSVLFSHLRRCRGCLGAYIALQAAAELASPLNTADDH
ncbi:MAG: hypothetical protein R3C19_01515 [Planctomycetaceae bacterium]